MRQMNLYEDYLTHLLPPAMEQKLIVKSREAAERLGRSHMSMGEWECSVLAFFTQLIRAQKAVEIGTLTGATAFTIAGAQSSGSELYTIERDGQCVQEFRKILEEYSGPVDIKLFEGPALDQLKRLAPLGPFDLVFIDADKSAYPEYLSWAKTHLRVGGLVIADNLFLGGELPRWKKNPRSTQSPQLESKSSSGGQIDATVNSMSATPESVGDLKPSELNRESSQRKANSYGKTQLAAVDEFNTFLLANGAFHSLILPFVEGLGVGVKL